MRRFLPIVLAALVAALPVLAQGLELNVAGGYYPSNHAGHLSSGFAPIDYSVLEGAAGERDLGSGIGGLEAKATLAYSRAFPFLAGEGALTEGNNVELRGSFELSPVSVNLVGQATLTPVAFLNFQAGAGVGTGWTVGFQGLALNPPVSASDLDDDPFGGAVWRVWASGTFQFDLAAVLPGEWNHVVVVASPKVEYKAYSGAADGQAWLWEADGGENFNGAKLYSTFFLGYRMPLALDTVGLLLETDEWLGAIRARSTIADGGWGSDFRTINFGPLLNFALAEGNSLAVLVQFKVSRDYTDATTLDRYFEDRVFEDDYLYFNRVALSWSLAL